VGPTAIGHRLTAIGDKVGIIGCSELYVAGALLTGQLDPVNFEPIWEQPHSYNINSYPVEY
jgi:hypothetical protein